MPEMTWKALVEKAREIEGKVNGLTEEMEKLKESLAAFKTTKPKETPKPKKKGFWESLTEPDEEEE